MQEWHGFRIERRGIQSQRRFGAGGQKRLNSGFRVRIRQPEPQGRDAGILILNSDFWILNCGFFCNRILLSRGHLTLSSMIC